MQVIVKENFKEMKAQLNETSFIRSTDPNKIVNKSPILSFMDSQKWILIGFRVLVALIGTFFISYKIL